jgi:hypothetical protein
VTVEGDAGADLQVTLVPLPAGSPRLRLRAECVRPGAVRLAVMAHDAAVTLEEAAWEKATPAGKPEDTSYRPEAPPGASVRAWFGGAKVATGEQRTSSVIELPPGERGAWLFKVLGRDAAGRAVAAEVEVEVEVGRK